MDYADTATLSVLSRAGADAREWPAVLRVDKGTFTETDLDPVTSYDDAQARMAETAADRLFIPADVLADMIAVGAGPGSSA
jgi:hypothetical protein